MEPSTFFFFNLEIVAKTMPYVERKKFTRPKAYHLQRETFQVQRYSNFGSVSLYFHCFSIRSSILGFHGAGPPEKNGSVIAWIIRTTSSSFHSDKAGGLIGKENFVVVVEVSNV